MKDKVTVATYRRVGNKEQLDTTGQEHKIPTHEELKAEGCEVVTLPDEKQDEGEAPTMSMGGG